MFRSETEAVRFLCFAFAGTAGFLVDLGTLAALHHGAGMDPLIARMTSIVLAACTSWRLNERFTLGVSALHRSAGGLRYAVVTGLAACLNYILYVLALMSWPDLPPIAGAAGATLVAVLFAFPAYSRFVFPGARSAVLVPPRSQRR